MTEQIGAKIKEARTSAGMTQKELAKTVDGVSADSLSKAERGLKELTDEQLAAIAEATGADPELFGVAKEEAPAAPVAEEEEVPAAPVVEDEDILELLNNADPAVKEAALSVLKGETPQSKSFLAGLLPMVAELVGADKGGNPLAAIIGFLGSEEGTAFLGTLKGIVENVSDIFDISGAADAEQNSKRIPSSFLAFTFFYTVAIYVLLLGYHYLQGRTDTKSEE